MSSSALADEHEAELPALAGDARQVHAAGLDRSAERVDGNVRAEPGRVGLAARTAPGQRAPADREALAAGSPAVDMRIVRDLKRGPSARAQNAADLAHVSERDLGIGDVLEDHVRETDVGARLVDAIEARPVPEDPVDSVEVRAEAASALEHARRDVE